MGIPTELAGHANQRHPAIMTWPIHLILGRQILKGDRLDQFTRDGGDLDQHSGLKMRGKPEIGSELSGLCGAFLIICLVFFGRDFLPIVLSR